jgi:Zn-dependent peptidase ImmA (M78 family)
MDISYAKIIKIFPEFNVRPLLAEDFWRVAQTKKIVVKELPLLIDGYYQKKRGKHFILINSRLSGVKWLHTAFHELFHYFLDVPPTAREITLFRSRTQVLTKREEIADALALMAVLPFQNLKKISSYDLEDNTELAALVRDRITVVAHFGL